QHRDRKSRIGGDALPELALDPFTPTPGFARGELNAGVLAPGRDGFDSAERTGAVFVLDRHRTGPTGARAADPQLPDDVGAPAQRGTGGGERARVAGAETQGGDTRERAGVVGVSHLLGDGVRRPGGANAQLSLE